MWTFPSTKLNWMLLVLPSNSGRFLLFPLEFFIETVTFPSRSCPAGFPYESCVQSDSKSAHKQPNCTSSIPLCWQHNLTTILRVISSTKVRLAMTVLKETTGGGGWASGASFTGWLATTFMIIYENRKVSRLFLEAMFRISNQPTWLLNSLFVLSTSRENWMVYFPTTSGMSLSLQSKKTKSGLHAIINSVSKIKKYLWRYPAPGTWVRV